MGWLLLCHVKVTYVMFPAVKLASEFINFPFLPFQKFFFSKILRTYRKNYRNQFGVQNRKTCKYFLTTQIWITSKDY